MTELRSSLVTTSFELALAQAIAWCEPRAEISDPAACLRSTTLRPPMLDDRRFAVSSLVDHRPAVDAAVRAATPVRGREDLRDGRLLVYFPDEQLADGAAEEESKGFFDTFNTPPWDTWVALYGDDQHDRAFSVYLVSWVPPALVDLATAGIRVNPEECIVWLDDADVPLRADLQQHGLID